MKKKALLKKGKMKKVLKTNGSVRLRVKRGIIVDPQTVKTQERKGTRKERPKNAEAKTIRNL